jgi:hypothetical protein
MTYGSWLHYNEVTEWWNFSSQVSDPVRGRWHAKNYRAHGGDEGDGELHGVEFYLGDWIESWGRLT